MTDPVKWSFIESVFFDALDLPAVEQEEFVRKRCAEDSDSAEEVLSLLAAHFDGPPLIDGSLLTLGLNILAGNAEDESPARVGRYRITKELGQGGMAVVYLAEREEGDFQHRVAVKVMRGGRESRSLLARFVTERQVLATLDHPNIARLYDGGVTDRGLPYIVMEYVDGVAFLEYCRKNLPELEDRLRLFIKVCDAVQHAHRNLIVHRDLKPGNILVMADGTPKLLDFGIAKIFRDDFKNTLAQTAADERLLTPAYASPEQIRGKNITTATDVYSLGVILYELLSGGSPYSNSRDSYEELIAAICDREPVRPSAGLEIKADEDLSEVERRRRKKRITGDLDTIALKALAKDPARRYASVEQMAEDIRRHLDGRPISARPDTVRYRVAKFVKRNRWQTAAAVLVMASMLGGTGVALWQARKARGSQLRAEAANRDLLEVVDSLMKTNQEIVALPGSIPIREKLIEKSLDTVKRLEQMGGGKEPAAQAALVNAYEKHGDLLGQLNFPNKGDIPRALESYGKAASIVEGMEDGKRMQELLFQLVNIKGKISSLQQRQGDLVSAFQSFSQMKGIIQKLEKSGNDQVYWKLVRKIEMKRRGLAISSMNFIEATKSLNLPNYESVLDNIQDELLTSFAYASLAEQFELFLLNQNKESEFYFQKAFEHCQKAKRIASKAFAEEDLQYLDASFLPVLDLYLCLRECQANPVAPLKNFKQKIKEFERIFRNDKDNIEVHYELLFFERELGIVQVRRANSKEGLEILSRLVSSYQKLMDHSPENQQFISDFTRTRFFLGQANKNLNNIKESEEHYWNVFFLTSEMIIQNPKGISLYALFFIPAKLGLENLNGVSEQRLKEIRGRVTYLKHLFQGIDSDPNIPCGASHFLLLLIVFGESANEVKLARILEWKNSLVGRKLAGEPFVITLLKKNIA